jgi:hypothetical protein
MLAKLCASGKAIFGLPILSSSYAYSTCPHDIPKVSETLLVLEPEYGTDFAMRTTPDGRLDGPIYGR